MITLGDAVLWISGNNDKLKQQLAETGTMAKQTTSGIGAAMKQQMTFAVGQIMSTGIMDVLNKIQQFNQQALAEAMDAEKVAAQLDAVLKSTGQAAGVTAEDVNRLANEFSLMTRYGDEAIVTVETLLIQTGKIGKDVLPQATMAVLDLSTRLGMDATSAAKLMSKALAGDAEAVSALTRAGVKFTAQQEETYKSILQTNGVAEAQKYLLEQLSVAVGGAAEAEGKTLAGALERLKNAGGNILEAMATPFIDNLKVLVEFIVTQVVPAVQKLAEGIGNLPEPVQWVLLALAGLVSLLAQLGPSLLGIVGVVSMFGTGGALAGVGTAITGALPALGGLGAALAAISVPVLALVGAIGLLIVALLTLGPQAWNSVKMLVEIQKVWAQQMAQKARTWFKTVGVSIVQGIGDGIRSGWEWLKKSVTDLVGNMVKTAKNALGIASPSKVFADEIGKNAALGIGVGFKSQIGSVSGIMRQSLSTLGPSTLRQAQGAMGSVQIGRVEYHGAFSRDELARLRGESESIAARTIMEAL